LRLRAIVFCCDYEVGHGRSVSKDILGSDFIINHDAGETVGVYKREIEGQQGMEDCRRDDLMTQAARALVEKAVSALMRAQHLDREAAHDWVREAAG
jgi:hypothetical protein